MTTVLVVTAFLAAYVLIATERIHRVAAALWGAAAMVVLGAAGSQSAFFSEETGIDWNVIFLLLGMMVIVGIVKQTGVFEFVAIWAAKRARGRPFVVMVMLIVLTAVASALLDNVTTVLLVAPVTLLVCERIGTPVVPFLLAEAMASNIGGTATLIGDPPNIIISGRSGLSFNDFVLNLGPVVVVLLLVFIALAWLLWGRRMSVDPERAASVMDLNEREAIQDKRLLVQCGVVLALVLGGFVLRPVVGLEPSLVALLGAGLLVALSRSEPRVYLHEVEWSTLVFFGGLFVMVGGLVHVGVVESVGQYAAGAVGDNKLLANSVLLLGSGVVSGIVDNIPYVATMGPIVEQLVVAPNSLDPSLWWSLALGADLGGNMTAVGASANVVILGIAARNGVPISFWRFTRDGLVVGTVTLLVAWGYVLLRYGG
ncbi:ArsB/NhaD family transporter [Dermatophilaceae bacterium Soc4.6]